MTERETVGCGRKLMLLLLYILAVKSRVYIQKSAKDHSNDIEKLGKGVHRK